MRHPMQDTEIQEAAADDIAADITDAFLRARAVQQRVMWICALSALIAAGALAVIVVTGHDRLGGAQADAPAHDGWLHIWSVSSVERRKGPYPASISRERST